MTDQGKNPMVSRRSLLRAFAATTVAAAPAFPAAAGFLRGAGDFRKLSMQSHRTGERIEMIYYVDGKYIGESLREINYFMRDWRNGKVRQIDPRAVDIFAIAHRLLETTEPFTLISGYRSPETNAMLASRSSGVARNSRHLRGEAADLQLRSRSVAQMYRAGMRIGAGGVGRYTSSNFVHMDSGPVRSWGR